MKTLKETYEEMAEAKKKGKRQHKGYSSSIKNKEPSKNKKTKKGGKTDAYIKKIMKALPGNKQPTKTVVNNDNYYCWSIRNAPIGDPAGNEVLLTLREIDQEDGKCFLSVYPNDDKTPNQEFMARVTNDISNLLGFKYRFKPGANYPEPNTKRVVH